MIHVFAEQVSPRLSYTLDFIFTARGLDYQGTTSWEEFLQLEGKKLNYSSRTAVDIPQIVPSPLLFETEIRTFQLDKTTFHGQEILAFEGVADPLASVFFVLSRYEEYWDTERDAHDRFPGLCSMQSVFGWLHEPICDLWAQSLLNFIGINSVPASEIKIQPTFDIDATYAYRHKGLKRNILGLGKELLGGKLARVGERLNVLLGKRKDPFDTFERIKEVAQAFPETRCFWLLADYGKFHKNLPHHNVHQQRVIRDMAASCPVGIHPGYAASENPEVLTLEKARLEKLLGNPVNTSRQHYLRLSLPSTYEHLLAQGIATDYSMGYADQVGFRMGTARKTPWFNLRTNEKSALQLQPFCYMDGTLNEYLQLTPAQALTVVKTLKDAVMRYGGTFSFIWHNETLGFQHHWKGWDEVFAESLG
jgi:hypothetical protein